MARRKGEKCDMNGRIGRHRFRDGYDLIREIEERTGGEYAPSPGMVYPTLTMLQDMGLIVESDATGTRKVYAATLEGTQHLAEKKDDVAALLARIAELQAAQKGDRAPVRRAMRNLHAALAEKIARTDDDEAMHRIAALLDEAQKGEIKRINGELAKAYTEFSKRVLADEETAILVANEADLAGLPDSFKASLAEEAKARGQAGKWAVKNTRSSMQPFLMYANNRALREQVYRAYINRGDNGDANDTNAVIASILKLRQERATILGFKTHADYRMDDTMAETPANAMKLMMAV